MTTNIDQLDLNGTYSYADCLKWQFDDFVEIIKGKVYKMPPAPTRYHQDISREIERLIIFIRKLVKYILPLLMFDFRLMVKKEEMPFIRLCSLIFV